MTRADVRLVIGAVLAVVLPALVLDSAAGAERRAAALSAAPFAWRNVLLAHLVAALPLGLSAAGWLRSFPALAAAPRWLWAALGATVTGVVALVVAPVLAGALAEADLGAVPLLLLRSFLALALVLPWCLAAGRDPGANATTGPLLLRLGIGLGLALVPCALYVEALTAARADEAATLMARQRLARAESVVAGLCELGSHRPVGKMSTFEARAWLAARLPRLRQLADLGVQASAPPRARVERAIVMIQTERLDEAAALLRPLVPGDDTATVMLAGIHRDRERWGESDALYAGLLDKLLTQARSNEAARGLCRAAIEGLAENARADHRPADAEAILTRGLRELPGEAAAFHFLLGRHYHEAGQPERAVQHLQTAARLNPAAYAKPADEMIQKLRTSTLGCLSGQLSRSSLDGGQTDSGR